MTRDDRAQLMLVGAITVAVIFLGLVTVLNTGLFTSNVAPRAGLSTAADAETFVDGVEADAPTLLGAAAETSLDGEVYAFTPTIVDGIDRYEAYLLRAVGSERPAAISVSLNRTIASTDPGRSGGLLVDDDATTAFDSADDPDDPDWTLVTGATETAGTITFYDLPVHNASRDDTFVLEADDGDDEWRLAAYWNETAGRVRLRVPSEGDDCSFRQRQSSNASGITVDLGDGDVGGTSCSITAVDDSTELDDDYRLTIRRDGDDDATRARGTYMIGTDGDIDTASVPLGSPNTSDVPYSVPRLDTAVLDLRYTTPSMRYATRLAVEPAAVDLPPPSLSGQGIVFVNDTTSGPGLLSSIRGHNGAVSVYNESDAQVTGAALIDFDADERVEIPFVDSAGAIWTIDDENEERRLTADSVATASQSRLSVGTWNGSPVSVFYAGSDGERIYRVTPGGEPVEIVNAANSGGTDSAVGPADVDGDGEREFVYVSASQQLHYYDVRSGIVGLGSGQLSSAHGGAVGQPHDFSGDGRESIPFVDGSGNLDLINATDNAIGLGPSADSAPMAVRDVNDDGAVEIVYLDNGEAYFVTGVHTGSPSVREFQRVGSNTSVTATKGTGVA